MTNKNQSIIKNKTLGHFIALMFFMVLGYGLYSAASNMNYIWKWTSVPSYFAYEEQVEIKSDIDGTIKIIDKNNVVIKGDKESKKITIPTGYTIQLKNNDEIYSDDTIIANYKSWHAGPLLLGLMVTLQISLFSAILAFSIGVSLAFMRLSSYQFLKDIATVYITVIRGTPLLVQIFIFYFIIATIFDLERFLAGALSLGIFFGAYIAEVLRGAIQSVNKGQYEAAKSLGMNYMQTMIFIIMPQALKRALPTLIGEMIALVKDSSLISVISITDLTKVGREIVANTFSPFETWLIVAAMYFVITAMLSLLGNRIEKKMANQGGM
ncbi:MAG: amino acid ABC transporter permease [Gammaproteobacteria bacterium]|nr:MAG: amino acid ABC transporter permease [Gammaproteobacteria bacterium]